MRLHMTHPELFSFRMAMERTISRSIIINAMIIG